MKRVVITGMGLYSCLGKNLGEVTESLRQGRSGIIFDEERKQLGFRSSLTGFVETPNLKGKLSRRERIGLGQQGKFAYLATCEALANAQIDSDFFIHNDVGIIYGNDSTADDTVRAIDILREKKETKLIGSGAIFQSMNSTVTMNLATIFKIRGINFTLSAACASGSHAVGLAHLLIRNGYQKQIICGGAQEINPFSMAAFDAINAFSIREDAPQEASRPFDKDRDGLVPGGGAATLIVEEYETAVKRGAPILGEILGYGFSSNGEGHITAPNVEGPVKALQMALNEAKIDPKEVDYINAHATSTPLGDMNEAKAIYQVFGGETMVSSTKSMTGHECWMAGASEIAYSVLMLNNGFIAPNINLNEPDEDSAKLNIISEPLDAEFDVFLSNSFGFGGTNAAIVVRKVK